MKNAVLGLLIDARSGDLLLGEKKDIEEIGNGILCGPGGKIEAGETPEECLVRETRAEWELEIDPRSIEKVAIIDFYAAGVPDFHVHVFAAQVLSGVPHETVTFKMPKWYPRCAIPYAQMFAGDAHWLPLVLAGEPFYAHVFYRERAKGFLGMKTFPLKS